MEKVLEEDMYNDERRIVPLIEEYESMLWLRHPENPRLTQGQTMKDKIMTSEKIFVSKVNSGEFNESVMMNMVREFSILALRVSNLTLDLNAKKDVVLVPSKRNYLYVGEDVLLGLLKDLSLYKKIEDELVVEESKTILVDSILSKVDESSQDTLEFRIIAILVMFLNLFVSDKQTISFLCQLMLNQHKVLMN